MGKTGQCSCIGGEKRKQKGIRKDRRRYALVGEHDGRVVEKKNNKTTGKMKGPSNAGKRHKAEKKNKGEKGQQATRKAPKRGKAGARRKKGERATEKQKKQCRIAADY